LVESDGVVKVVPDEIEVPPLASLNQLTLPILGMASKIRVPVPHLGTINLGAAAIVATDKVTYAITFFIPNAANDGFTQIGDSTGLVFAISATALVTP
jgi:hypothetical protein